MTASTSGSSEEEDDFDERRPDLNYYEYPSMPAVLNGTLVAQQITYNGVCASMMDDPKEK